MVVSALAPGLLPLELPAGTRGRCKDIMLFILLDRGVILYLVFLGIEFSGICEKKKILQYDMCIQTAISYTKTLFLSFDKLPFFISCQLRFQF